MDSWLRIAVQGASSLALLVSLSIAAGLAGALIYLFVAAIYNVFFHPLRNFPGPTSRAASYLPFMYEAVRGSHAYSVKQLHDKYGPAVRIGPDRITFNDPAAFKDIYGHRPGRPNMAKAKLFYRQITKAPNIIVADDATHSRMRRAWGHAFSSKAVEEQQYIVKEYIDLLIKRLKPRAEGEEVVDMVAWYNWTTFDIIGDLAFGSSFSCLQDSHQHPWIANIFGSIKVGSIMLAARQYSPIEKLLTAMIPPSLVAKRTKHLALADEKIKDRLAIETSRKDFTSYILKNKDKEVAVSRDEISANAGLLVIAGSETTATLLSGVTYYLLMNRPTLDKLVSEIRSTFKTEDELDFESVSNVPYLIASLDEGLRMYPPVPIGLPRTVPEGGDTVAGFFVPGGTIVEVQHKATYQSSRNFNDPDSFLPERFLAGDRRYEPDAKNKLNPFSVGPRNCIGQHLANVEMRLILARVLWNFDLELSPGSDRWVDQPIYTLYEKSPLMVKLRPRKV